MMKNNGVIRRVARLAIRLCIAIAIGSVIVYFVLPSVLSSGLVKEKAVQYLSVTFKRPVVVEDVNFSWKEGISISHISVANRDRTPFFMLHSVQLLPDWRALLTLKLKAASLTINEISATITRDNRGKIQGDEAVASLPQKTASRAPNPQQKNSTYTFLPALFADAHIKEGVFTFIDQRLNSTTQIKNFSADIHVRSFSKPMKFFLQGAVVLNNNPPEPLEINGSALFFFKEKMKLPRARGNITLKAGFGNLEGFFDLKKFDNPAEVTGGRLTCSLDLERLSQLLAGVLGFPPGYLWKGNLQSSLEARGNFNSQIAVTGATQVTGLAITGKTPFEQPPLTLSQEVLFNVPAQEIKVKTFDLKTDSLNLSLSGTINDFLKTPWSNLALSGTGNLKALADLMKIFSYIPADLNLSGITRLSFSGTGPAKNFHLKGSADVGGFNVEHPALKGHAFTEDNLRIFPDLMCNLKKNRVTIPSLLIQGKSLTGEIKGTVTAQRDIDLESTLSLKLAEIKKQLSGALPQGFPAEGESFSRFTVRGNLKDAVSIKGEHSLPLFSNLMVTHNLIYSLNQDSLTVAAMTAQSPVLNFKGQGTITQVSTNPLVKSEGKITLVLEEAQKLWEHAVPKKMTLAGNGSATFAVQGPLKPAAGKPAFSSWTGQGALSLDSVHYQGLGALQNLKSTECRLDQGVFTVDLEGLLNNGPATAHGSIDFNRQRPAMNLKAQGEDIQLSPEQTILGYVIPISSRATQLTGTGAFSLQASWQGTNWGQEISKSVVGEGKITLRDGTMKSEGTMRDILGFLGKSDTIEFDQILCPFRLGEEKIYDNTIQITGNDIALALNGWTSLSYDPEKKGNPIRYTVTGASLKKSRNKDMQKIVSFLGSNDIDVPIVIKGTVQKPKVSIKFSKAKKFFKKFFNPPENSSQDLEGT